MNKIIYILLVSVLLSHCSKYKDLDYVDFNNNPKPSILYTNYAIHSDTVTNKKNDQIEVCFVAHSCIQSFRISINDSIINSIAYDNTNQNFSETHFVVFDFKNSGDSAIVRFELTDFNKNKVYDSLTVYYFDGSVYGNSVKAWYHVKNQTCYLGQETVFQNRSANNPISYIWDFGDGTTSTEEHPTHTYTQVGEYPVTLIAKGMNSKDTITFIHAVKIIEGLIVEYDFDNNEYRCIPIGDQIWFSQDLKTSVYNNMNPIQGKKYPWLLYNFMEDHGYLYNWSALLNNTTNDIYSICPNGYHVPSIEEWKTLFEAVGGKQIAGKKLKAPYPYWNIEENSGDNSSDFDAIASGDEKSEFTTKGYYWTATEATIDSAYAIVFDYSDSVSIIPVPKNKYISVRCIKN